MERIYRHPHENSRGIQKMTYLTDEEIEYIIEYTGLDMLMEQPVSLEKVPVIHFSKNNNIIEFITILSKDLSAAWK